MKNRIAFISLMALTLLLPGCGGGGSGGLVQAVAVGPRIMGVAATGLALSGATVRVRCTGGGEASTVTDAQGQYSVQPSSGQLPCMLSVDDVANNLVYHSVATADVGRSSAVANLTPLTELLTAKLLGLQPEAAFARFASTNVGTAITPVRVAIAQADVVAALGEILNTAGVDFVAGALRPATTGNPGAGDAHDQLLDTIRNKLAPLQQAKVVSALADGKSLSQVQQLVGNGVSLTAARLTSVVDLTTRTVRLEWLDGFPAAVPHSFRVEAQNPDGSFGVVETLASAGGGNVAMVWERPITGATVYRVQAVVANEATPVLTATAKELVSVDLPAAASQVPQIVLDRPEPVSGVAQVSLNSPVAFAAVTWYEDLRLVGSGSNAVGHALTWNTSALTDGPHLLLGRVQVSPDVIAEVRRSVLVSNTNLAMNVAVSGTTGTINVDVTASSKLGITRVDATLDGSSLGSLTLPNACASRLGCGSANNLYRFSVNASTVGSGLHTLEVTATDGVGTTQKTVSVPISNPPQLNLVTPVDGAFVSGSLQLGGSTSSDKAGAVTVTASLGDVEILRTTSPAFSTSYSLSGLNPGTYSLTLRATDSGGVSTMSQRTVTVTAPGLVRTPLFTMGAGSRMLAAEGSHLLYQANDTSVRLRNTTSGLEVLLADAGTVAYASGWLISDGRTYAYGKDTDCVLYCVYQWASDGARKNLSNPNPYSAAANIGGGRAYDLHPIAHDGYVLWVNDKAGGTGRYTLYNVALDSYTQIAAPAGSNYVGNWEYDFAVVGGAVNVFYWAQTGGEGLASTFDVFRWSQTTGLSTKLSGSQKNVYPQTDGNRVAWRQFTGTNEGPMGLVTQSLEGSSASSLTLSNNMMGFMLRDGVLAWTEATLSTSPSRYGGTVTTTSALKAVGAGLDATLSSQPSAVLYAVGGGGVIYGELGKTWRWNATTRSASLLVDAAPGQVLAARNVLYLVMGSSQTVYRLDLN